MDHTPSGPFDYSSLLTVAVVGLLNISERIFSGITAHEIYLFFQYGIAAIAFMFQAIRLVEWCRTKFFKRKY